MKRSEVLDLLSRYRANEARMKAIPDMIKRLERERAEIVRTMVDDQVRTTANADGMPRSGRISDPTAEIGSRLADGWVPERVREIDSEIDRKKADLERVTQDWRLVDNLFKGLNYRDVFILKRKYCDQMILRDIRYDYQCQYSKVLSEETMSKYIEKAVKRLCALAE